MNRRYRNETNDLHDGAEYHCRHGMDSDWSIGPLHMHPHYEFYLFVQGKAQILIEDESFDAQPMDLFIYPPGVLHRALIRDHSVPYERAYCYITRKALSDMSDDRFPMLQILESAISRGDYSYHVGDDSAGSFLRLVDEWIRDASSDDPFSRSMNRCRINMISLITCNHDTVRPSFNLDERERKLFYSFLFTMPGVPFLYYGDEIGMRYRKLPTKEGGYFRTGSRTPMQWDDRDNLGFSTAVADALYLPVDPEPDAPTVQGQEKDSSSLLNLVRTVISLRHQEKDLQADGDFRVICSEPGRPFVYQRGNLLLAVNPSGKEQVFETELTGKLVIYSVGAPVYESTVGQLRLGPQSFVILK